MIGLKAGGRLSHEAHLDRSFGSPSGIGRLFPFARRGYVCASIEYRLTGVHVATTPRLTSSDKVQPPITWAETTRVMCALYSSAPMAFLACAQLV